MIPHNDPSVFDTRAAGYDTWFDKHFNLFQNELSALRKAIPGNATGIDIGAGTGRFTQALGISIAAEPSPAMAQIAIAKGITVVKANAEELPFHDRSFDFALMVTVDCFLSDISQSFREARRVLKNNGFFILGMIDKGSELGISYDAQKATNPWYKDARFHAVQEITGFLQQAGFTKFEYWQTIFSSNEELTEPRPGYGTGSFVVIRSQKI